jgi:prepilin-type N-terminal cleavage/methylation domain-containing protein
MRTTAGFTLIEVVLALTILLIVMVGLVTTTGKTAHVAVTADRTEAAIELVQDKIDRIRIDPYYGALDSAYTGTESSFPSLPGFTRTTTFVRVTTSGNDYKKFTVTVTGRGLPAAGISRTVTVGAP